MIDVRGLRYTYPHARVPAVRGVTFRVEKGEVFGFLGPSGAGKSTTQKILIGLQRDYDGTVTVLGRDLHEWGADYYEHIGVSFEFPNHYLKLSALENLALFRSLYRQPTESPESVLEAVGLAEDADKPVGTFSKGMRIRLNLARALLHRPEILFLDEPTAGLDPVTARALRMLIRSKQEAGTTVFLTTHDMAAADALCSRVAFIVDGEIRLVDRPDALKGRYGQRAVRVTCGSGAGADQQDFPLNAVADNHEFLALLRRADLRTIHTLETTLEEVFVQVTGRGLA
jgi:fluoroquinolone transport system ATP-binding protein